ncbi:helix-turn-helix domain-containing protein [Collinsella ihumii]|uniref:Helix-turn-helix domain-containing protein n=1 Tax=Collinsella ihumii TaxID=1720204 RepID=A0ABT7XDH8_9ACTN|nr:helix-turn-helix domain-containing protein [Collinsella ihumii]MDN0063462.1 helix-turn-helix domain-containing protein [Collinsella ihumii]
MLQRLLDRPYRFNELQHSIEGISQKSLTENLHQLEADEIVTRTVYPEVPPHVEYRLSAVGESMRPIIESMESWGTRYQKMVRRE